MTWFFRIAFWGGLLTALLLLMSAETAFISWALYFGFYYGNRWWMRFTLRRRRFALYFITAFITAVIIGTINLIFYAQAGETLASDNQFKDIEALMVVLGFLNYLFVFFLQTLSFQSTVVKDWFHGAHLEDKLTYTTDKLLKTELNPHLFKNMLNNIYSLVLQKKDEAAEAIVKLKSFMEYMLYDTNDSRVPLEREIAYIRDLVEIEKLRLPENFNLKFSVTGNAKDKYIAPLLLLPFVENVFRHADLNSENGYVNISIKVKDDSLEYAVKNKVPKAQAEKTGKGGKGLTNLKARLKSSYTAALGVPLYSLETEQNNSTYTARLELLDLDAPDKK